MKIFLSLLIALSIGLSGCAQFTDWATSPGGQVIINAALSDALHIVTALLLAAGPQSVTSLRDRAIIEMMETHPGMSYSTAAVYVDQAISIKLHVE